MPPSEPPSEPTQPSRFAFMNPVSPNGSKLSFGDSSAKHRLIVVGGGAVVLIILLALFYVLVLAHKPSNKNFLTLAQEQTELIKISGTAEQQASQQITKNLAVNTSLTLTTGQEQLFAYLKTHGQKITTKQLTQGESTTITQELNNALAANNFDAVYTQIVQNQLSMYLQSLNQNLGSSANNNETQLLKSEINTVTLLQNQANSNSKTLAGT